MSSTTEHNEELVEEVTPIFSFPQLKEKLISMGIAIGKAGTWRAIGTIDVLPEDIGKRIIFKQSGIYFIDDEGVERKGFMYKKAFYFEWDGEKKTPKFHIFNCEAIDTYGRDAYRYNNSEPIKVFSRNKKREVMVEGMELCGYCRSMLDEDEAFKARNSTAFVELLKEEGNVEEVHLDFYGYVKNWEMISLEYRKRKNFTCEHCGIQITDPFDQQFIHTHHRNGDKTDNRESNLRCLCIKCHSQVNKAHIANFSKGGNKVLLDEFTKKYPDVSPTSPSAK